MSTLGTRLTYLREKKGWTKTYVAKKLGMKTVSTYANWEYDTRQPDNDMIVKIAELFEVSADYLLGRTEQPMSTKSSELSEKDEKDVAKEMERLRESLTNAEGLHFDGEPLSDEALESILEAMEYGVRMAKKINKKYTPKKYLDKDE